MFSNKMDKRRIIFNCHSKGSYRRPPGALEDKCPGNTEEAIANIEKWYSAGIPVFTRTAIRQIDDQLKRPFEPGQKILVKGLDGSSLEFDVLTGMTYPCREKGLTSEILKPVISYNSYVQMKSHIQQGNDLMTAYFPLQIDHEMLLRDTYTNEAILPSTKDRREVNDQLKANLKSWKASPAHRQLESILSASATKHAITKVIGIGCGSMASDDLPGWGNGPYEQHALIRSVRDWAADKQSQDVACYAQDPVYTGVDKAVLEESGIQVIDDPRAWLEVDDSSVVFSSYPDIAVREMIADLARPAVLICNRVVEDGREDGVVSADPNSPRVHAMIQQYLAFEFWGSNGDTSKRAVIAYVRK